MSLSPKISLSLGNKCNKISANDVTGIYDPVSNTGGWGAPNLENTNVIAANFTITNVITPAITLNYNITAEIIAATVTNSFNVLFEGNFSLGDGIYDVDYTVESSTTSYSTQNAKYLFICNLLNCKDNLVIKLINACTSAEVTKLKEQVDQMEIFIYGIQLAFEQGDYGNAQNILDAATKYCQVVSECKTC